VLPTCCSGLGYIGARAPQGPGKAVFVVRDTQVAIVLQVHCVGGIVVCCGQVALLSRMILRLPLGVAVIVEQDEVPIILKDALASVPQGEVVHAVKSVRVWMCYGALVDAEIAIAAAPGKELSIFRLEHHII